MFSRSRPRQLETEEELHEVALRALTRRAHSVQEMKQKLARYTRNDLLVRVVLARLKESGRLNDETYAKQFVRNRTESRKQGQFRIARELRARGVPDSQISSALEESAAQTDPAPIVRQRIQRKLLRAGFPTDLIRRELKRATREDVPETEPPDDAS